MWIWSNKPYIIERISISLALPISTLFNKSLNLGQFPDILKMANVIPVFKGKDPSIVNNYRPISLLSCLGKVLERCIFKHLSNYLRGNNLISMNQSGFTPGNSTTNQLVSIYHDVCTSLDNQKDIQLIFLIYSRHLIKCGTRAFCLNQKQSELKVIYCLSFTTIWVIENNALC